MGIDGKIVKKEGALIINIDVSFNIVSFMMSIIQWSVIGYLAYRGYKRLDTKPRVWKILFALLVGLFAFTINMEFFHTLIKIPILPLGVWILYGVLRSKEGRWDTYRRFAWIGFLANFIFLAGTLLTIPIHSLIYPANNLSTYITGAEEASINIIHPSGEGRTLDQEKLEKQLSNVKQAEVESWLWYEEVGGRSSNPERFPYQLVGTTGKWGSGLNPDIYMEQDGKGILISTRKTQYYYRFPETVLEEEE